MPDQHPLERRSALLATRAVSLRDALVSYLGGDGERPPFTEHKPKGEALDWWEAHIDDDFGKQVIAAMRPERVMQLRAELGARIAARRGV